MRQEQRITQDQPGDAAAGPDAREVAARVEHDLRHCAEERRADDEHQPPRAADDLLDVVAEHDEEPQIAQQVPPAGVHEERGQHREPGGVAEAQAFSGASQSEAVSSDDSEVSTGTQAVAPKARSTPIGCERRQEKGL